MSKSGSCVAAAAAVGVAAMQKYCGKAASARLSSIASFHSAALQLAG